MGKKDEAGGPEENQGAESAEAQERREGGPEAEPERSARPRRPRLKSKRKLVELEERLAKLEEDRDRFEDLWLRARADLENFRKRVERDQAERDRRAGERILLGLLEVRDNLEKALDSVPPPCDEKEVTLRQDSLREGLVLIDKQMASLLAREGVSRIDAEGTDFDPQLHEAVMQVESEEHESDKVVQELQTGYLLGDRLLRPARVAVAK